MSGYEALVIVHVVMAAAWLGGGIVFTALAFWAWGSRDPAKVVALSEAGDYAGTRVFAPAAILLLASGAWAVHEGNWEYGDAWVSIGFAGWVIGLVIALAWHVSEGRRIRAAVAEGGADGPRARSLARAGLAVGIAEVIMLIVVVWAMVAKPGA
ncbi:MAG: DUF2269 family protein [Thermoleophilia bacterium]|nr:DUF2269 family protein [Thermoleophilia bacterium]